MDKIKALEVALEYIGVSIEETTSITVMDELFAARRVLIELLEELKTEE